MGVWKPKVSRIGLKFSVEGCRGGLVGWWVAIGWAGGVGWNWLGLQGEQSGFTWIWHRMGLREGVEWGGRGKKGGACLQHESCIERRREF